MPQSNNVLAVFPGTFDPITHGHLDIVRRAGSLFREVIVAVGRNPEKEAWFSPEERLEMIRESVADLPNVRSESYDGLTMDYVRSLGAGVLVRGIRDGVDLREELHIASLNRMIGGVETVFLMSDDHHTLTSSTLIKQIVTMSGLDEERMARLVPPAVVSRLAKRCPPAKAF